MHPAYSVIFFTVSSGIGFGMLMIAGGLAAIGRMPADGVFGFVVMATALAAAAAGLLSSTLHLGHPERAWRALSQWRTSWLSREGVAAIATFPPALGLGWGWVMAGNLAFPYACAGGIAALLALATVFCTGKIYQSLVTIRAWHDALVTPVYVVLALASGALWLAVIARALNYPDPAMTHLPIGLLVLGWVLKWRYWVRRDADTGGPTVGTATGLGRDGAPVRLLESPHTQDNFVMREMGYRIARKHAVKLRRVAQVLAFALPIALTGAAMLPALAGWPALGCSLLAAAFGTIGIATERWLFFAEARHAVTLFYGAERA
jgi:DMSO reductase anchor subunit